MRIICWPVYVIAYARGIPTQTFFGYLKRTFT